MASLLFVSIITTILIIPYAASTSAGMSENVELSRCSSSSSDDEGSSNSGTSPITRSPTTQPIRNGQYFFSSQSYTWKEAQRYCKTLGSNARLAEFRSVAEYRSASNYIMRNTGGGHFWIGGIYKSRKWQWASGGCVDESIIRWPNPPPKFTRNSRLSLTLLSRFNANWMSHPKTESMRLLCQL